MLEKHIVDIANGQKAYLHAKGVSGPPTVISEGNDLHLQFLFLVLQLKTYYQDYSGEGDTALGDLVAERVVVDVVLTPTIDQRMLPTYHSVRVAVSGVVKEADKCTYFFAVVFPLNICKAGAEYIAYIKTALENEIRESLLQPPTRMQFEQQVFQVVRTELLAKSGINPMSPAQVQIIQAEFRGTDYVVSYLIR